MGRRSDRNLGNDPVAKTQKSSPFSAWEHIEGIRLATVVMPQPEPLYREANVSLQLETDGTIILQAPWPGPNVEANAIGIPFGPTIGIHGLYEAPLPGQQVVVGFLDGSAQSPIVLQKYPHPTSQRVDNLGAHFLPMSQKAHGPTDVVLGHHTGAFVALRGLLPIPAEVDIFAPSIFSVVAGAAFSIVATAVGAITAGTTLSMQAGGAMTISAGATVGITAAGVATINASALVIAPTTATVTMGAGTQAAIRGTLHLVEDVKLTAFLTAFMAIIAGAPIPEPGNGAASALQAALAAATAATPIPTYTAPALLSTRLLLD